MASELLPSEVLSERAQYAFHYKDFLTFYMDKAMRNPFHPETNPNGIVNLGTSVSRLMENELTERLLREDILRFESSSHQHYYNLYGTPKLTDSMSSFFNRYFSPFEPVHPTELVVLSGTGACLDSLAFSLLDPGDIYLTPTPTYGRIFTDFNDRSLAIPYELVLPEDADENGKTFSLNATLLEKRILELKDDGKVVKVFVLLNPHNPLGDIYSPKLLRKLLEVCAKFKIHVIVDEIYAMSTFTTAPEFRSIMSLPDVPDPQRTHVVWGMSKDFSLAGFRVGVIWTKNAMVRKVLQDLSMYCCSASIIHDATATILSDYEWLDEIYFSKLHRRLQEQYNYTAAKLKLMGAEIRPSHAGFFIWFNLKKYLKTPTREAETALFEELFNAGVYIVPGKELYCSEPGWFRLIFAMSKEEIDAGLLVIEKVLRKRMQIKSRHA